jgi:hypothetical protein
MVLKKYLIIGLICFLVGAALCGVVFYCLREQPSPVTKPTTELTVNPSSEAVKKADKAVKVTHEFTIAKPDKMAPGDKQTVPVSIKVKDVTTNTTTETTGAAEATKTETGDIQVSLPETIVVDTPKPPPKTNELGIMYNGDKVIYYKKDLVNVWGVAPWLGASYNVDDKELKFMAGACIRW